MEQVGIGWDLTAMTVMSFGSSQELLRSYMDDVDVIYRRLQGFLTYRDSLDIKWT